MNIIGPSLAPAKHPHIIWNNPPPFACPRIFLRSYFSRLFWWRKTHIVRPSLSFWTAHSSEKITPFQYSCVQSRCSLAHLSRFFACSSVNNALSAAFHFWMWSFWRRRRIVDSETSELVILCNTEYETSVWTNAVQINVRSYCTEVFWDLPVWGKFSTEPRSWNRPRKVTTVDRGIFNSSLISVNVLLRPLASRIRPFWSSECPQRVENYCHMNCLDTPKFTQPYLRPWIQSLTMANKCTRAASSPTRLPPTVHPVSTTPNSQGNGTECHPSSISIVQRRDCVFDVDRSALWLSFHKLWRQQLSLVNLSETGFERGKRHHKQSVQGVCGMPGRQD